MGYEIDYTKVDRSPASDMEEYITDTQSKILTNAVLEGCNYRSMHFIAAFSGVQGKPVTCWMRETREMMATH